MLNKLMYNSVLVKSYKSHIYGIVIVVSIRADKILLKMVVSDRNM
jgi:ubiquinone biosynthesis protein UbiJ